MIQFLDFMAFVMNRIQNNFTYYEMLETDDKEHVAIVFERTNRAGVPLNSFQLFTAWSWSESFDLQDELSVLSSELEDFGFGDLVNQQELLLICFTGIILGNTAPKSVLDLDGTLIRNHYEEIKNGIIITILRILNVLFPHHFLRKINLILVQQIQKHLY